MTQLYMRMGVISALRGTWNNITFAGAMKTRRPRAQQMHDIATRQTPHTTLLTPWYPRWTNPNHAREESPPPTQNTKTPPPPHASCIAL